MNNTNKITSAATSIANAASSLLSTVDNLQVVSAGNQSMMYSAMAESVAALLGMAAEVLAQQLMHIKDTDDFATMREPVRLFDNQQPPPTPQSLYSDGVVKTFSLEQLDNMFSVEEKLLTDDDIKDEEQDGGSAASST